MVYGPDVEGVIVYKASFPPMYAVDAPPQAGTLDEFKLFEDEQTTDWLLTGSEGMLIAAAQGFVGGGGGPPALHLTLRVWLTVLEPQEAFKWVQNLTGPVKFATQETETVVLVEPEASMALAVVVIVVNREAPPEVT